MILFVIVLMTIPIVKLSILTAIANKNNSKLFLIEIFWFLNTSIIIEILIYVNITKTIISVFIFIKLSIIFPKNNPSIGIKKWNKPIVNDILIISLLDRLFVPYANDKENASKDKPIEVKIIIIIFK